MMRDQLPMSQRVYTVITDHNQLIADTIEAAQQIEEEQIEAAYVAPPQPRPLHEVQLNPISCAYSSYVDHVHHCDLHEPSFYICATTLPARYVMGMRPATLHRHEHMLNTLSTTQENTSMRCGCVSS